MPGQSAVELFGEWAKMGRDEGMEQGHSPSVEELIHAVIGRTPGRFSAIDVGCGNGWAVRKLSTLPGCYRSSGVDGSQQMIDKARSTDPEGEYFLGNLPAWRPEEKSDLIMSMEFIYYLDDPLGFFQILNDDWLSDGGSVAFGLDHYLENESSVSWPDSLGGPNGDPIDRRVARWFGGCRIHRCRGHPSSPKGRLVGNSSIDWD